MPRGQTPDPEPLPTQPQGNRSPGTHGRSGTGGSLSGEEVLLDLGRGSGQFPLRPGLWPLPCGLGQGSLPSGQRPSPEPLPQLLGIPRSPCSAPSAGQLWGPAGQAMGTPASARAVTVTSRGAAAWGAPHCTQASSSRHNYNRWLCLTACSGVPSLGRSCTVEVGPCSRVGGGSPELSARDWDGLSRQEEVSGEARLWFGISEAAFPSPRAALIPSREPSW